MNFREAKKEELEKILTLYKSVIKSQFCTWNDNYPSKEDIQSDFDSHNLFVMCQDEKIIGAASIVSKNEMDSLPFWKEKDGTEKEISRVVISKEYQGKGLADELINYVISILKHSGCHYVHLAVAIENIPAFKAYRKIGFEIVGQTRMWDINFYLLEKKI